MISYLGVTLEELVSTFEDSLAYTEARLDREYSSPYSSVGKPQKPILKAVKPSDELRPSRQRASFEDWDDWDDDDAEVDVYVDDNGVLHSLAECLPIAAEAVVGFLTDYIVTDELDDAWLNLELARGALLGLRICLPAFEDIPEVMCAYKFKIDRDPKNGLPVFVSAEALPAGASMTESLTRSENLYEGVVSDDTSIEEYFDKMKVPEAERYDLGEAISEAVFALADEQCGIAFDAKKFRSGILRLAAKHRMHVVPSNPH